MKITQDFEDVAKLLAQEKIYRPGCFLSVRDAVYETFYGGETSWDEFFCWLKTRVEQLSKGRVFMEEGDFSTGLRTPEVKAVYITYKRNDGSTDRYHFAIGAFDPPIQYLPQPGDR